MSSTTKPAVLIVLSSVGKNPITGAEIGWYLPEFAHAYDVFSPSMNVVVTFPLGGEAPLDSGSVKMFGEDPSCANFLAHNSELWKNTAKLEEFVGRAAEFEAMYFVGGHGPMFDLVSDPSSLQLIQEFSTSSKVLGGVCHGSAAFLNAKLSDGSFLIAGAEVTGFSNSEEDYAGLTAAMPFLLETELHKVSGGGYVKAEQDWGEKVVVAKVGKLVTGQNPSSAKGVAVAMLEAIKAEVK